MCGIVTILSEAVSGSWAGPLAESLALRKERGGRHMLQRPVSLVAKPAEGRQYLIHLRRSTQCLPLPSALSWARVPT